MHLPNVLIQKVAILGLQSVSKMREELNAVFKNTPKANDQVDQKLKDLFADLEPESPEVEGTFIDEQGNIVTSDTELNDIIKEPSLRDTAFKLQDQIQTLVVDSKAKTLFCALLATLPKYSSEDRARLVVEVLKQGQSDTRVEINSEQYLKMYDELGPIKTMEALKNDLSNQMSMSEGSDLAKELEKYQVTHHDDKMVCVYNNEVEISVNTKHGEFYYQTLT